MAACAVLAGLASSTAHAMAPSANEPDPAVAEFYHGRRMVMISGYTPEGGDRQQERAFSGMTITSDLNPRGDEDLHGRLLARHMGSHIPGAPHFVVQTMPGAGGRRATGFLLRQAARDGSVIGNLELGLALEPLMSAGSRTADDDATKLQWIGSLRGEIGFAIAWTAGDNRTPHRPFEQAMLVGGTSPTDDSVLLARALNALIGTHFRIISGYSGTIELQIAMERGEIAGFLTGSGDIKSRLIPWTQTGQARALLQLGLQPDPDFPDVPLALDFARTAADREALAFIFARQTFGSPYAAPPGVPAARLQALRRAFDATMHDDAFREDARRLDIAIQPIDGETLQAMMARLIAMPDALRERVAAIIGPRDARR
jgi:tripartite-type tricarboxylate transporter receptor subunit TctC